MNKEVKKHIKKILKKQNKSIVLYYKAHTEIMGSVSGGLFLSQVFYWWQQVDDDEFYHTNEGFKNELGISDWEIKRAKKKLKQLGLCEIKQKEINENNKWYKVSFYKFNFDKYLELLNNLKEENKKQTIDKKQLIGEKQPDERLKFNHPIGQNSTTIREYNKENIYISNSYCDLQSQSGDKNKIYLKEEKEFNFKDTLEKMINDKRRHIHIIGLYWRFKGYYFENKGQYQTALKRDCRPAKNLVPYSDERILDVMNYLEDYTDIKWTLETVIKYIDEDLYNLQAKRKKPEDYSRPLY